jgi:hypothetical protein
MRERVSWGNVHQEAMTDYQMMVFHVRPEQPHLDPIHFLFDQEVTFLVQIGMGIWHTHLDEIDDALDMASKLVRHELCILEERDERGEYRSSGPVRPDEIPRTLGRDTGWLSRIFFDREPVREEIDFSRYFRGKHLWIEPGWKDELEQIHRAAGMPVTEW